MLTNMKALVLVEPGRAEVREIETPRPGHGEVLLQVRRIGLCGTDLNSFRGKNPLVTYPRIPGHEIAATIAELGPGVPAQFQAGMDVTVAPYFGCGDCTSCRQGRPNACRSNQTLGVQRDGALVEAIAMPWQKLLPAGRLALNELVLVEPLTIGFHAARRARVAAGDTVAVLGAGTVGLGAIAAATGRGARAIAIDMDDRKLDLAKKAGASAGINAGTESVHDRLQELTSGDGPNVVIEAIGLPQTYRTAVEEVAFGGRVVYVGWTKEPVAYETRLFVLKELDMMGSRNATTEDFLPVIELLESGKFPMEEAVSRVVPIEGVEAALRDWDRDPGSVRKVLVEVSS